MSSSIWEAKAGGLRVLGQYELHDETGKEGRGEGGEEKEEEKGRKEGEERRKKGGRERGGRDIGLFPRVPSS